MNIVTHRCSPSAWCGLCDHNAKHGGRRNHPKAPRRPPAKALASAKASSARKPLPVIPCRFVGDDLTGAERTAKNLDHRRQWTHCDHPKKPLGEAVCGCAGCGPRCPGYAADTPPYADPPSPPPLLDHSGGRPAPGPRWQPVPPPAITPARDRLVVCLAVGEASGREHALTGPSQRRYAERIGADYVVIGGPPTQPWWGLEKFRYRPWVQAYRETITLDADVWVSRSAPDLFALVPAASVGVSLSPEWRFRTEQKLFAKLMADVMASQGEPVPPGADDMHFNSGLAVLRREHADFWAPPPLPLPAGTVGVPSWIAEELWCKRNAAASGWPLADVPHPAVHWQWWLDRDTAHLGPPLPAFVHPAGMTQRPGGRERRADLLRALEASGA